MPIKQASIKSLRQTKKRTARRAAVAKKLEAVVDKMRHLLSEKKKNEAQKLAPQIQKMLDKAAKTKVVSKNRAARLKSQLMKRLASL